jgi:signal transduction histidine kinase
VVSCDGISEAIGAALQARQFRAEDTPLVRELMQTRQLVVAEDGQGGPWLLEANEWVPGSWIAVPLERNGSTAGLLSAGGFRGPSLSRRQLRLAEGLGHHFTIALQNARLVSNLEAADRLKSEFVSTMSHELRTPLNVIIGYTEMLRDGTGGGLSADQVDLIHRVDDRSRELLELIEATLCVGRIEAGRADVDLTSLTMDEIVRALQAATAGLPCPPGVEFSWQVSTAPDDRLVTDRAKLALVVRNLVSNAFKFTERGAVTVRLRPQDDTLVIEVNDTGIGIGSEHLPIIFDMFRQVDGTSTRRHAGVGLGLYIVKQFANRLGAVVSVESALGTGSTFRVVVPRFSTAARGPQLHPGASAGPRAA